MGRISEKKKNKQYQNETFAFSFFFFVIYKMDYSYLFLIYVAFRRLPMAKLSIPWPSVFIKTTALFALFTWFLRDGRCIFTESKGPTVSGHQQIWLLLRHRIARFRFVFNLAAFRWHRLSGSPQGSESLQLEFFINYISFYCEIYPVLMPRLYRFYAELCTRITIFSLIF